MKTIRDRIYEQVRYQVSNQICDEVVKQNKVIWNQ